MSTRMRLLIAYDGSACANEAMEELSRAGLPAEGDALVVAVAEVWVKDPDLDKDPVPGEASEAHVMSLRARQGLQEAEFHARKAAERFKAMFPNWEVELRVYPDSPTWGVLRAADEWKPDLIVVGSHGRSALGRLIVGSVSLKVLTEATCPVRISRRHADVPGSPIRLVIGVDGTPDSDAAVRCVAGRNWPAGTAVRVVAAVEPSSMPIGVPLNYDVTQWVTEGTVKVREHMEKAGADAVAVLQAAGLTADAVVVEGSPVSLILEEARALGADAVFLGARGHRFMERFLLGSVSASVATRAECSVEVVRPIQYADDEAEG